MSPSDFGRLLKPFVFLDLIDNQGEPFSGFGLHPHRHRDRYIYIYIAEGSVRYEDTNGATGLLRAGGIEWMRAGGGVWHGGGSGEPGRTRGFQLWIALPPDLELGPSESIYPSPEAVPIDGPARVLIGSYGAATSSIKTPSSMNYLAVHLKAGERWSYQPPAGHTVLWTAVGKGLILVPDELQQGELVALTSSSAVLEFEAGRNEAGKSAVAKVLGENAPLIGPGDALAVAQRLPADTIVFFLNPQRVWEQADIVQGIWNLRDVFKAGGQMLVLVTPPGTRLPVEVQNDVMVIDEPLHQPKTSNDWYPKHSSQPICRYRMSASSRKPLTQLLVWRRFQRSRP